jgi:hypothetical protein
MILKLDGSKEGALTVRKIISLIHVSLDGFAAGPNDELDWISYDDELDSIFALS